ncbi:hypothetical protein HY251_09410, partial [bacterium]|nr:hypothetical protein [bacterium]
GGSPLLRALLVREDVGEASLSWLKSTGQNSDIQLSWHAASARDLPDQTAGYDTVDLVALSRTGERAFDEGRRRALMEWVQRGGTVLLLPGADPAWLRDDFIKRFLPGDADPTVEETTMSAQTAGLIERLRTRPTYRIYTVHSKDAGNPSQGDDWPLFTSWRVGNGLSVLLRVDLETEPFQHWLKARDELSREILAGERIAVLGRTGRTMEREPSLEGALEVGESPSPLWMVPVVLAYIACVGPINFALLKRRQAQVLILATTPLVAAAFTLFVFLNGYVARGFRTVVQRATVLEMRSGDDWGVQRSGLSIYSSSSSSYKVSADAALLVRHPPNERTQDRRSGEHAGERVVQDEGRFSFPQVPLDLWERAFFEGRGLRATGGPIAVTLSGTSDVEVSNKSSLALGKGAVIFHAPSKDGRNVPELTVCAVPPLAPGKTVRVSIAPPPAKESATATFADALLDEKMDATFARRALAGLGLSAERPSAAVYAALLESPLPSIDVEGWAKPTNELSAVLVRIEAPR